MPGESYLVKHSNRDEPETLEVLDLFLCESQRLVLRPGQLYRFRVDPDCEKCKAIEAEGEL